MYFMYLYQYYSKSSLNPHIYLAKLYIVMYYPLTIYNIVIWVRSVIKFLGRNFLFIEKVQAFLDLIMSRALARAKYKLKRREPLRY